MTTTPGVPGNELDQLAEEMVARGLVEQADFVVDGRKPDEMRSSEYIGIRGLAGSGYQVWYPDNAIIRVFIETDDFEAARAVFVDEAVRLAKGRGTTVKKAAR
ncbi:hypothetical protein ACFFOS_27735 [Nocardioides kongjuensis]|uniref:Uncharacterized protein n=1 Tax=Nocardioides kongjuensis TaxID=349522 RepID=A0A852RXX6_9ACTN|nr:hypothetical protein [Nocardioides kongjuensis]NYD32704.1 hypothetical protein [Nocardioides kongjuensis]